MKTLPVHEKKIVYSTTDGRQQLHDILQDTYGDKAVIGFDRYGRVLGAVVPLEAVAMLAGQIKRVDGVEDDIQGRVQRAAQRLMQKINDPKLVLTEIDEGATGHGDQNSPSTQKAHAKKRRVAA